MVTKPLYTRFCVTNDDMGETDCRPTIAVSGCVVVSGPPNLFELQNVRHSTEKETKSGPDFPTITPTRDV